MDEQDSPFLKRFEIVRYHNSDAYPADDVVAREEPLEIRLNDQTLVYLMRLPGDDVILALGFCLSEGLMTDRAQIELVHHCTDRDGPREAVDDDSTAPGNLVEIKANLPAGVERFDTARVVRTGCGGADLDREIDLEGLGVEGDTRFGPGAVAAVPDQMLDAQEVFRVSGGTHAACLFDASGSVIVVKEDVGRHNAVDKVLGHMLMSGESPSDKGLMLSGRLSYEMVLKAARAGISLVCSISAPTALGVEVGRKTGVTLVGFLRGGSFNVYSHPARIGGE